MNLPLEAGAGDADLDEVFRRRCRAGPRRFRPELVLVSAGFDAHRDDPLGGLRMTPAGFANLARLASTGVVHRHAGGRVVYVTEGGYDIDGLTTSLDAVLGVLADRGAPRRRPRRVDGDRTRGRQTAADARHALVAHWPGL